MGLTIETAKGWEAKFAGALAAAAAKAGVSLEGLEWERCDTDRTWGDRVGLVFFGCEGAERAAKFFEKWAGKNLRKMKVVGGYEQQESIGFEGPFRYLEFANGARGWYRGTVEGYEAPGRTELVKTKQGFATSFVYYPCAD